MIKSFYDFNAFSQENSITLETINLIDYDIIDEEYNYKFYTINNKTKVDLKDGDYDKLQKIETGLNEYIESITPIKTTIMNNNKQMVSYSFNLKATEHFITKFLRQEYEDNDGIRGITNPELYEGINLIYKNINYITKSIESGFIKKGDHILAKSKGSIKLGVIFIPEMIGKKNYELVLISQMKGMDFNPKYDTKIIKIHPNGEFIKN